MATTRLHSRRFVLLGRIFLWMAATGIVVFTCPGVADLAGWRFSRSLQYALLAFACGISVVGSLPSSQLPRWGLLTLSLIGALFVVELSGQWLLARSSPTLRVPHPRWIYAPRPGASGEFRRLAVNGSEIIPLNINSTGYRGPELLPAGQMPRVAVYGDSFIAAEFSNEAASFTHQLEQRLSEIAHPWKTLPQQQRTVEVVNAGVIGYGPDQSVRRIQDEISALQPDVIVIGLVADNDFGDLLRNRLWEQTSDGAFRERISGQSQIPVHELRESILWHLLRRGVRGWQTSHGATPSLVGRWLTESQHEYEEFLLPHASRLLNLATDNYDADIAFDPESESAQCKRRLMITVLRQLSDSLQAAGIPGLVVVIPSPGDLIADYEFYDLPAQHDPDYDPRRLTDWATTAAEEAGLPVVNLFDDFAAHNPRALYFRGGDNHWNDAGQALAARIVSTEISRRGWLGPARRGQPNSPELSAPLAN